MVATSAVAAPINEVSYGSIAVGQTIDFEGLAPGTNYDSVLNFGGVKIGERFAGQTLSSSGNSDVLGGTPSSPLNVIAGATGKNVTIFDFFGTNVLAGLGPTGFPNFNAIGEGAIAILFDNDQSAFGFESVGGNLGDANFDFFARDGSLIGSLTPTGLGTDLFGFSREGGVNDIAGISIWNTDQAGIGFDNIIFDVPGNNVAVPAPATFGLLGIGLFGLGVLSRRQNRT
jgi:hypothetical protein